MSLTKIFRLLAVPGSGHAVQRAAPTHWRANDPEPDESVNKGVREMAHIEQAVEHRNVLDRGLDWTVVASGSWWMFAFILLSVFAWAFCGIPYGQSSTWQVFISDYQAILTYFFDSLLMRQQFQEHFRHLHAYADLKSRLATHARLVPLLQAARARSQATRTESELSALSDADHSITSTIVDGSLPALSEMASFHPLYPPSSRVRREVENALPKESRGDRWLNFASNAFGSLIFIGVFWAGIIVWLAFGPSNGWSNRWQLYCNSATSALMVFVFAFVAHVRERHSVYAKICLAKILETDAELERCLRDQTGDDELNPEVCLPSPPTSVAQRAIDYYAELVSMLFGIAILTLVVIIWVCLGPVMHFNANWWLLIGTYAGLIGMNDGFVLRNVSFRLDSREHVELEKIEALDGNLFGALGLDSEAGPRKDKANVTRWISAKMGVICSSQWTVLLGVLVILGLIIAASVLRWSETGQLLCNVPPSVIESFFMIILLTGHNLAEESRRSTYLGIYVRREYLVQFVGSSFAAAAPCVPAQDADVELCKTLDEPSPFDLN